MCPWCYNDPIWETIPESFFTFDFYHLSYAWYLGLGHLIDTLWYSARLLLKGRDDLYLLCLLELVGLPNVLALAVHQVFLAGWMKGIILVTWLLCSLKLGLIDKVLLEHVGPPHVPDLAVHLVIFFWLDKSRGTWGTWGTFIWLGGLLGHLLGLGLGPGLDNLNYYIAVSSHSQRGKNSREISKWYEVWEKSNIGTT